MRFYHLLAGLLLSSSIMKPTNGATTLFDFTDRSASVANWTEISDVVREVGKSKAVLSLQSTHVFQRAVFFSLLNPQLNGAGFAGVRVPVEWDLSGYKEFRIKCRGQGQNYHYKIVLRHNHRSADDDVEYEQLFDAPKTFDHVRLPLTEFKPYFRGRENNTAQPLDLAHVTMFGFQIYGGVYSPFKQQGVSALEIDTIEATRASE
ncbi:uncharacterized protein C9E9.15 isoform X2 [Copidosoma floridanum]|uniref:uncharacterized protein C9E9.15 isoform X2 n=1 Tax=Copidosoma floridanum TaxID=29053 RepID=UPI000C6FB349|nr:uncharacterized protein C9E9.15 isoform X2 [Copidosoma floridanum]